MKSSIYSFYSKHILTLLVLHTNTTFKERKKSKLLQNLWGTDLGAMAPEEVADDALLVTEAFLDEITLDESDGETTEEEITEESILAGFTFWEHAWEDEYDSASSESENESEDSESEDDNVSLPIERSEWNNLLKTLRDERISDLQESTYTQSHSQITHQHVTVTINTNVLHSTKINFNKTTPLNKLKLQREAKTTLKVHRGLMTYYSNISVVNSGKSPSQLNLLNRVTKVLLADMNQTCKTLLMMKSQFLNWVSSLVLQPRNLTSLTPLQKTSTTVRPQWAQFNTIHL